MDWRTCSQCIFYVSLFDCFSWNQMVIHCFSHCLGLCLWSLTWRAQLADVQRVSRSFLWEHQESLWTMRIAQNRILLACLSFCLWSLLPSGMNCSDGTHSLIFNRLLTFPNYHRKYGIRFKASPTWSCPTIPHLLLFGRYEITSFTISLSPCSSHRACLTSHLLLTSMFAFKVILFMFLFCRWGMAFMFCWISAVQVRQLWVSLRFWTWAFRLVFSWAVLVFLLWWVIQW